jgi:hypothetical protein
MSRRRWAAALPPLLLLAFYWPSVTGWFFQDDFGWLRLRQDVQSISDLPAALFAPKAHGNMRPLGENAYWLALGSAFGVRALPFRIVTFATQIAALLLLGAVAGRLTKSPLAAFSAQLLWIASCGLAPSLGWSSIYNQVLSGFFFLLAFYFFLRHSETGEPRWWRAQWIAFILGLGALETNVVYPALAALYAFLRARPLFKKTVPMFAVSALSAAVHFHFAPAAHAGPYSPRLDTRVFSTLWTYWTWSLGRMPLALAGLLTLAAAGFALHRATRHDYTPLFALAWFVITLGPYLPLPDHTMDYYLAVPSIGIALLGALALAAARQARVSAKLVTAACLLCYIFFSSRAAWAVTRWEHDRGIRAEDFVSSVEGIRRANPGKAILLDGMDNDLFWAAMANLPFHALDIPEVFLTPDGAGNIDAPADFLVEFVLPSELTLRVLRRGQAVVYRFDGDILHDETARYRDRAEAIYSDGTPRFINIGDPIFAEFLGPGWDPAVRGYRTMPHTASLRIAAGRTLSLGIISSTSFELRLGVDGVPVPLSLTSRENDLSLLRATLPPSTGPDVTLTLSTSAPLTLGFAETR